MTEDGWEKTWLLRDLAGGFNWLRPDGPRKTPWTLWKFISKQGILSSGNEDYRTWNTFNALFAKPCLSVLFVEEGHAYSKFVFITDKDKGLDKSLAKTFPRNHATNCVHHIMQNLKTQFGPKAEEMVFPIATAFLTIQEETSIIS